MQRLAIVYVVHVLLYNTSQITEDEVDFWKYKEDFTILEHFKEQRCYPPKVTLEFTEACAARNCKVDIFLFGAVSSEPLKDSITLVPQESKQNVSLNLSFICMVIDCTFVDYCVACTWKIMCIEGSRYGEQTLTHTSKYMHR